LRVALVEASDLSRVRNWSPEGEGDGTYFSNRVSSITNASRRFLQGMYILSVANYPNFSLDIGAWQHVDESRTTPIEEMQVWDGISDSRIEFNATQGNASSQAEMARLTENLNLQRALLRRINGASSKENLTLYDGTKVTSISSETGSMVGGGWPILQLSNSQTIRARLLVGADGPNSPVRSYSKIDSYGWPYNARAIVATLQHAHGLTPFGTARKHTTAYQRFLPTGPIAFLPLSQTRASLVWSTTPELAQALLDAGGGVLSRMVNAAFRLPDVSMQYLHQLMLEKGSTGAEKKGCITEEEVEQEIRWRERAHSIDQDSSLTSFSPAREDGIPASDAGMYPPLIQAIQAGSAASFPLRMNHADTYLGSRTALVGDAAHTTHPLAGQGLNLGIADAESLARTVQAAAALGLDLGSHTALEAYPCDRYLANHGMLSGVDKLSKLYGTRMGPMVWARSVGLEVVNEWTSVKEAFMGVAGAGDNQLLSGTGGIREANGGTQKAPGWPVIAASGLEVIGGVANSARTLLDAAMGSGHR
jgi:ubiquinone biosynthesis monooxygenase Coq6